MGGWVGGSHNDQQNIHILITSEQKVDNWENLYLGDTLTIPLT